MSQTALLPIQYSTDSLYLNNVPVRDINRLVDGANECYRINQKNVAIIKNDSLIINNYKAQVKQDSVYIVDIKKTSTDKTDLIGIQDKEIVKLRKANRWLLPAAEASFVLGMIAMKLLIK